MRELVFAPTVAALLAGLLVGASLAVLTAAPSHRVASSEIGLWEAYARGFVTLTMVNLTVNISGQEVPLPYGILVKNSGPDAVNISEDAVLMSPAPVQTPAPNPLDTTEDAVITPAVVPAGGNVTYAWGPRVLEGKLHGPMFWFLEEQQSAVAGVPFSLEGQILPFALQALVDHPNTTVPSTTQEAVWAYPLGHPAVVVSKEPLWSAVNATAGQTIPVRVDATNLGVWVTDVGAGVDVNVTGGAISDTVPAGWSVQSGSFSVAPDRIVNNTDGSTTLVWLEDLPAAQVTSDHNQSYPVPYVTVSRSYVLVSPALNTATVGLPRASSSIPDTSTADAVSEAPILSVAPPPPTLARADFRLALAGEKGHDATLTVHGNGTDLASLRVLRSTGAPAAGSKDTGFLTFNASQPVSATVLYTPKDDAVNGRPNGDNPAFLTITFPDGKNLTLTHNFNTQHASTWTWDTGDLRPIFRAMNETFIVAGTALHADSAPSGGASAASWLIAAVAGLGPVPLVVLSRRPWEIVI